MQNFYRSHIGIDVGPVLEELEIAPWEWERITARQEAPASAHKDTHAILLTWCPGQAIVEVFEQIETVPYPSLVNFPRTWDLVQRIVQERQVGRVMLARLKPGGQITRHVDEGGYALAHDRWHLPIQSEEGNVFYSELADGAGEYVHMRPGELWWFDNKRPHFVTNGSIAPRIHLIMDILK